MPAQKIRTFLWFDHQAEEAANFYVSLFKNSKVTNVTRCSDAGPGPAGSVLTIQFELAGVEFIGLNGGPHFHFTEAISLSVDCESQAEVDQLWEKFIAGGGSESQCGWLKDKYGLSWQIVPSILPKLLSDPKRASRVMPALMQMKKLDVAALERAADGK